MKKRFCKCGQELIPRKRFFKSLIVYKCPNSNLFNKKNHSVSKAYILKAEPYNMITK